MHVGHLRSYAYPDVQAKFKRLQGYDVYFPAGIHATGLPAVQFSDKVRSGQFEAYLRDNNVTPEMVEQFQSPEGVVAFFTQNYSAIWRQMGFFLDQNTGTPTTIDVGYQRFIQWQFRTLNKRGYLVRREYVSPICPKDGPVAIDAAETDLSEGGTAEVSEFTVIKLRMIDSIDPDAPTYVLVATLRPETIFGLTNAWVHPSCTYVVVTPVDQPTERWVVAEESVTNFQGSKPVEVVTKISSSDLVGKSVRCPTTEVVVPLVPSSIVDPALGTGAVMSVPAHAPADWIAHVEVGQTGQTISEVIPVIIESPIPGVPAETVCKEQKVVSSTDIATLKKATEYVYAKEYYEGRMNERCGTFVGLTVQEARQKIIERLTTDQQGFQHHFFNQRVVCRCGERVQVRVVPNQWFIRYSDPHVTAQTQAYVRNEMKVYPRSFHNNLPHVLDWFQDRPATRKGKWLGTHFPPELDEEGWVIEPIADSTIYPAYYFVAKALAMGRVKEEDLTEAFFDYVYLGKGCHESAEEVRRDFLRYYPLDMNFGGQEHRTVHFPVFLMMHQMIFPPQHQPRGIFANWWVMQSAGKKISKSKGGAGSITQTIEQFTPDAIRFFYCHVASPHIDVEFKEDAIENYQRELDKVEKLATDLTEETGGRGGSHLEQWLEYKAQESFAQSWTVYDSYQFRKAAQEVFYTTRHLFQRFIQRGGRSSPKVRELVGQWMVYVAPVAPFMAERVWKHMGNDISLFNQDWLREKPTVGKPPIVVQEESYVDQVVADIAKVQKAMDRKGKVVRMAVFTDRKAKFGSGRLESEVLADAVDYIQHKTHLEVMINPESGFNPPRRRPKPRRVGFSAQLQS